jgi:hypothetical protein
MPMNQDLKQAYDMVTAIRPILAGKAPHTQGIALADLVATWIASHAVVNNTKATSEMRERMLKLHVEYVRQLVDVNEPPILKVGGSA